jgi:Ca2+-transporting ATPase
MTVRKICLSGRIYEVSGVGYRPEGEFSIDGKKAEPDEHMRLLLNISALCNDAGLVREEDWQVKGDATEGALIVLAAKGGVTKEKANADYPRISEIPFTSESKRMTTVHRTPGGLMAYSKGALEVILNSCTHIYRDGKEESLGEDEKNEIMESSKDFARDALRILGLSYKSMTEEENVEREMVFVGFVGMIDPPRPEVKDAIQRCEEAGIKVVMITGDHKITAMAVAKELGMLKKGVALEGSELEAMSDDKFDRVVEDVEVYARVSPEHKLRIVKAFKKKGHIIAMTGDGINDAPALKSADIGVAMGITGTDVTKEAAAMILTDDNFASIVDAVEEGRGIFGNVKKYLMYLLSSNLGEILLMAIGVMIGLPLPLVAIQILWVNLATDGLPAIALSVDPTEKGTMKKKPRDPKEGVFTRPVVALMIIGGIWSAFVNLYMFWWALGAGIELMEARSMIFVTLILIQFFKAFNYRSDSKSIFELGFFANRWLLIAIFWETILMLFIVYLPFLQEPFSTHSLTLFDWGIVILAALTIFPILEGAKLAIRKGWFSSKKKQGKA